MCLSYSRIFWIIFSQFSHTAWKYILFSASVFLLKNSLVSWIAFLLMINLQMEEVSWMLCEAQCVWWKYKTLNLDPLGCLCLTDKFLVFSEEHLTADKFSVIREWGLGFFASPPPPFSFWGHTHTCLFWVFCLFFCLVGFVWGLICLCWSFLLCLVFTSTVFTTNRHNMLRSNAGVLQTRPCFTDLLSFAQ